MNNARWKLYPLGDAAVLIEFGQRIGLDVLAYVQQALRSLEQERITGVVEYVPSYTTLTVYYDMEQWLDRNDSAVTPYEAICTLLQTRLSALFQRQFADAASPPPLFRIPVCYGGQYGPDLAEVAAYHRLSTAEVVRLHSSVDYTIYALGFAPGFPYLGGMPESIAVPRRNTPRLRIPAGSVGIAGMQTGIYPLETPGGWQLIGRTPVRLFRPEQEPPVWLESGGKVQFYAITPAEYAQWQLKEATTSTDRDRYKD
ncbi:5-oxoprolinase subunit PxpB [Paenibacillus campi]|uniref:5-oxoprolinase subunit PxpB n=1 Tax=Paenibacillus campi TaxID=3106031 RepID=UPI002AFF0DD2|nr:5-oxoprolinase subunit PxpB [Paenibacillus sp. SGZ-1009]